MTLKEYFEEVAAQKSITLKNLAEDVIGVNYHTFYSQISRNEGMGLSLEKVVSYLEKCDTQLVLDTFDPPNEYVLDGEKDNL